MSETATRIIIADGTVLEKFGETVLRHFTIKTYNGAALLLRSKDGYALIADPEAIKQLGPVDESDPLGIFKQIVSRRFCTALELPLE